MFFSNAMTFTFMNNCIPIVYYGQEQGMHGISDHTTVKHRGHLYTRTPPPCISSPSSTGSASRYQDEQRLLNTTAVHIVDHGNQHRHSKGFIILVITNIGSPVGDWRSFRDVANFDVILASKYQCVRLYSLQAQRSNY